MTGSVAVRAPTIRSVTSTTLRAPADDGTELFVRNWRPGGEPWAFVLLVHGLAEHSGRYEHVGARLAAAGLDVTAYDQRGFGASGGRRAFAATLGQSSSPRSWARALVSGSSAVSAG